MGRLAVTLTDGDLLKIVLLSVSPAPAVLKRMHNILNVFR